MASRLTARSGNEFCEVVAWYLQKRTILKTS